MADLRLYNPTTDSCDFEVELSNPFNTNYYRRLRITSTNYRNSTDDVDSYVESISARNSSSRYVRGVVNDGMSAGRTYRLYAYAQARNGTWYLAGSDTITMEDDEGSKEFDYGIRNIDPDKSEPFEIGEEVEFTVEVKNYERKEGPRYKVILKDMDGNRLDYDNEPSLDSRETNNAYVSTRIKAEHINTDGKAEFKFVIEPRDSEYRDSDRSDNEKTEEYAVSGAAGETVKEIQDGTVYNESMSASEKGKWYKIKFAQNGKANFWINSAGLSNDLDLFVYTSEDTSGNSLDKSTHSPGAEKPDDIVRGLDVTAGVYYYVYVKNYGGEFCNFKIKAAFQDEVSGNNLMDRLRNDTSLGLSQVKKNTLVVMGTTLVESSFTIAFVAGVLGNILHEATVGLFESSAYISNPSSEPAYLKYVDEHFNYRKKFSSKNISDVGIHETYELVKNCKATNYKGKFGLGCVQWTGSRTMDLIECYIDECGEQAYPTREQCYKAESTLISKELNGRYKYIYEEWLSKHSSKDTAAYEAGSIVCLKYEVPADRYNKAKTRGNSAQKIYKVMMGN